ncbi:hypothetical protein K439DRAFT_1636775 [Ramaria rubella]|nr:hypothetical protein K439DRAFT_1636775 [Ramaria rubella]
MSSRSGTPPLASQDDEKLSNENKSFTESQSAVEYSSGVDVAVDLVVGKEEDVHIDKMEFRQPRRKIDWHILPLRMLYMLYTGRSFYIESCYQ